MATFCVTMSDVETAIIVIMRQEHTCTYFLPFSPFHAQRSAYDLIEYKSLYLSVTAYYYPSSQNPQSTLTSSINQPFFHILPAVGAELKNDAATVPWLLLHSGFAVEEVGEVGMEHKAKSHHNIIYGCFYTPINLYDNDHDQ